MSTLVILVVVSSCGVSSPEDCAEAEAELGHEAKQVQQTELLQSTFECYFRILKTLSPEELVKGNRYKKARAAKWNGPSSKHQVGRKETSKEKQKW